MRLPWRAPRWSAERRAGLALKPAAAPDRAASWLVRLSALRLPSLIGGESFWWRANNSDADASRERASLSVPRHPEVAAQRPSKDVRPRHLGRRPSRLATRAPQDDGRKACAILARDSGGGRPREAWWRGRLTRSFVVVAMIRGVEAFGRFKFKEESETEMQRRCPRPTHRATRGPPSPLSRGGTRRVHSAACMSASSGSRKPPAWRCHRAA
jgi:hypothetical protein